MLSFFYIPDWDIAQIQVKKKEAFFKALYMEIPSTTHTVPSNDNLVIYQTKHIKD